ncbi:hypothetical protein H4W34_006703 [Actinomadura algeriensis]|uniref:Secreted protein n=1 Tax=Actinomadura algeriensis TaxID=1679523 RepID=A0ABR9K1Z3_9ACTN|nr:hypothetical protein [Actinomadura algeriensis]MBE1536870.1 hypothetical protein [Actinomadura algeriensis]
MPSKAATHSSLVRPSIASAVIAATSAALAVGVHRADVLDVDAQPRAGAGKEVGEEHVAGADQLVEHRRRLRLLQSEPDAALAAVRAVHHRRERRAVPADVLAEHLDDPALRVALLRVLHLDDVGAPVREDRTGGRDVRELGDLEDPDAPHRS